MPIPLEDDDRKNYQGGQKNNHQGGRKNNHQGRKKDQLSYVVRHIHLTEDLLKLIAEGFSKNKSIKLSVSLIRNKDSAQNEQKLL